MRSWRDLPGPARAIGAAVVRAVDAAAAGDREDYEARAADLAAGPVEPTGIVLAAVVRTLLEEQHPDGLDADDMQLVIGRCAKGAAWLPAVDPYAIVAVLASALGVHEAGITYDEVGEPPAVEGDEWRDPDPDPAPKRKAPTPAGYAFHAPLLIADLLAQGGRGLDRYLDGAFGEILRAETMEMP
jgi:hypothetical protein